MSTLSRSSGETLPKCLIQDWFIEQARLAPDRPAVIAGTRTLSYGELLRESQAWARRLRQLGAGPNTLVAVAMEKGWEQIVAVFGILQAGAAYLPIDPKFPKDRFQYLLENSQAQIALTQSWLETKLEWPENVVRLAVDTGRPAAGGDSAPIPPASPDDLAYVLYTSGSTGRPKGVMIGHRSIINCVLDTNRTFQVGPEDRAIAVTALHHDLSVYDIFGLLSAGGAIVIPDAAAYRSPDHWVDLIDRHQVSVWNSVPGFMEMLLEYAAGQQLHLPDRLKLVILGGDWVPLTAPARIHRHFGDQVQVVSIGGPTETTVWNIWYPIRRVDPAWSSIPYGHAIANTTYYILDEQLNDCAPGTAGELCCSGASLMKGYWRDEEQTRARLTLHPRTGERIFRTGDRGRLRPDGEIEFLGRLDSQVKINGHRIELGEIEYRLIAFPGVKQAAVKVVQSGRQQRLAAFFVPDGSGPPPGGEALRAALASSLPQYMVPYAYVPLAALPLNGTGKVDRAALPTPEDPAREPEAEIVRGSGKVEEVIQSVWRKVLAVEHIRPDDNFFDLGGDSVRLMQVHHELEKSLSRTFSVTELFEFPSLRALSKHLAGDAGPAGLSLLQQRAGRQRAAMARPRVASK